MLERLQLRDFQAHHDLDLGLSAPIVTLVGPSDSGKSSVLRALRWLCTGQAPRSPMATWGQKEVKVTLKVDGKKVERVKGKENTYAIDGKKFAAVGQGNVPDEVAALLNVSPQNFQQQHSGHFFLADTPGEVARQLNSIVNLSLIDDSLAAAASFVRDARQADTLGRERLEHVEARKAELGWVEDADAFLKGLEVLEGAILTKRKEAAELARLVREGQTAEEAVRSGYRASQEKDGALQGLYTIAVRHVALTEGVALIKAMLENYRCQIMESERARAKADALEADLRKRFPACPICQRPMPSSP